MKMNAFEIRAEFEELLDNEVVEDGQVLLRSTGEVISVEEFANRMAEVENNKDQKLNNICAYDKGLEADNAIIDKEIERLQTIKKSNTNKREWLRKALIPTLLGGEKWKDKVTGRSVYYTTTKKCVLKVDAKELPPEYQKVTVEAKVNEIKNAILKQGADLSQYADIVENKSTVLK